MKSKKSLKKQLNLTSESVRPIAGMLYGIVKAYGLHMTFGDCERSASNLIKAMVSKYE